MTNRTIKTLERSGATVVNTRSNQYAARFGSWSVEFYDQSGEVVCLRARRITDLDESQSDYSAGSWFDSLTKCIAFAQRMAYEDANGINRRPGFVCPSDADAVADRLYEMDVYTR